MDSATSNLLPSNITHINQLAGPLLLAALLNCGLLGVLSVQVYLYYLAFPGDQKFMKYLVYGIYVLEVLQSVLLVQSTFRIFVTNFQDVGVFDRIGSSWLSIPILTAIDTFIVQGFYAHRISILSDSKKVAGAIVALSFIQLGGGVAVGVYAEKNKLYSLLFTPKILVSTGLWNVGSVLCDLIIAICMIYYLSRYDTTIKQTKVLLKKIIRLTIESGSLIAVIAITSFVMAILPTCPPYYRVPMGIIGKVYANSMLVLNNSRMLLGSSKDESSTILSEFRLGPPPGDKETITDCVFSVNSEERTRSTGV